VQQSNPNQKLVNTQPGGQQQNPQKPVMQQNPNKQFISRPVIVPPNNNNPNPPKQNPANGQGNNQKVPGRPNPKKADSLKHQPKKIARDTAKRQN